MALQSVIAAAFAGQPLERFLDYHPSGLSWNPWSPLPPDNKSAIGAEPPIVPIETATFGLERFAFTHRPLVFSVVYSAAPAHWPAGTDLCQELRNVGRTELNRGRRRELPLVPSRG